jgi:MFS family permease
MSTTVTKPAALAPAAVVETWRTPAVIVLLCGCLIGLLTFGPRSAAGQFLTPLSFANGWGRDMFSMAFAIQNLLWGLGQPFAGAIADRFGAVRVLCTGAVMYGLGLAIMAYASNALALDVSAGVLIGNRWGGMLYGFAFYQVGGFLGVLLGGLAFERTGSYDALWWLSILFGVLSALINLPIVEKPVQRLAIAPA